MEPLLKCAICRSQFVLDRRTRRMNVYKCVSCGRELSVRKQHNTKPIEEKSQNQN
jgi:DNA-directed RNA polymerase subunit RPC12/RpoP